MASVKTVLILTYYRIQWRIRSKAGREAARVWTLTAICRTFTLLHHLYHLQQYIQSILNLHFNTLMQPSCLPRWRLMHKQQGVLSPGHGTLKVSTMMRAHTVLLAELSL
jgi:hypothetical protein